MGEEKIKVILDANIYASFFLTGGETVSHIISLWKQGAIEVFASIDIIAEILRLFRYPKIEKRISPADEHILTQMVEELVIRVHTQEMTHILRDPHDEKYLEAALACNADYVVTGDKDLLSLKEFGTTKIVSPKEFVEILQKKS